LRTALNRRLQALAAVACKEPQSTDQNRGKEKEVRQEISPGESDGQRGQRRTGGFRCLTGGWWPDMVGFMPCAIRVDRVLGEHGIGQDSAAGRQEFERQMERSRLEAIDEEAPKPRGGGSACRPCSMTQIGLKMCSRSMSTRMGSVAMTPLTPSDSWWRRSRGCWRRGSCGGCRFSGFQELVPCPSP